MISKNITKLSKFQIRRCNHNNLILKNLQLFTSIPEWHQPVIY